MAERITDELIRRLEPPKKGNRIIYDAEVSGFGIRATAGGAKSFILNYRIEGRERRYTIGTYGRNEWGVAAARKRAGELRKMIARGDDPLAERVDKRQAPTISDLCDLYIEDYLPQKRLSSQRDDKGMIKNIIRPKLGTKKIGSISRTDIKALHRSMKDKPYRANRVLALLSAMFNFAINDLEWPIENKVTGITRNQEVKRKRYLEPKEELPRLIEALNDYPDVRVTKAKKKAKKSKQKWSREAEERERRSAKKAADIVRLCLLTGCRRGEALGALWSQFNFESEPAIWTKPAALTKQDEEHEAPLSDGAVMLLQDILTSAPRGDDGELESEFVFPGRTPDAPLSEIKDEWQAIRKAAKIEDVRLHDLRHTYASILVSAGVSLPIVGALLGHTQPATTARYAHLQSDPQKKATDIAAAIISGKEPAEVIELPKKGGAA